MLKTRMTFLFTFVLALGCNTPSKSTRNVASDSLPKSSKQTWLYTWTNNPEALKNPRAHIESQTQAAAWCLSEFKKSRTPVENCEGNGFAAGPGIYACDNPFTSHDYGTTVIITRSIPNKMNFLNYVSSGRAADVMTRENYAYPGDSAIIYNFRASNANTKAIVIRKADILDVSQTTAITINNADPKKFKIHPPYACTEKSSAVDVLKNWGDQMEFMSITFFDGFNYSPEPFAKDGKLNKIAYAAAAASDAVANANLEKLLPNLIKKYSLEESLSPSACEETSTNSLRSCLAMRIFDSLQERFGHGDYPRYTWEIPTVRNVLVELGVLKATEAKGLTEASELVDYLAAKSQKDAVEKQRIQEAYHCMEVVRNGMKDNHLALWATEPE